MKVLFTILFACSAFVIKAQNNLPQVIIVGVQEPIKDNVVSITRRPCTYVNTMYGIPEPPVTDTIMREPVYKNSVLDSANIVVFSSTSYNMGTYKKHSWEKRSLKGELLDLGDDFDGYNSILKNRITRIKLATLFIYYFGINYWDL